MKISKLLCLDWLHFGKGKQMAKQEKTTYLHGNKLLIEIIREGTVFPFFADDSKETNLSSMKECLINKIQMPLNKPLTSMDDFISIGRIISSKIDSQIVDFIRASTDLRFASLTNIGSQLKGLTPINFSSLIKDHSGVWNTREREIENPVYVGITNSHKVQFKAKQQPDFFLLSQYLQKGDLVYREEFGMLNNIRLVKYGVDLSSNTQESRFDEIIIFGQKSCYAKGLKTPNPISIYKNKVEWNPNVTIRIDTKQIFRFSIDEFCVKTT